MVMEWAWKMFMESFRSGSLSTQHILSTLLNAAKRIKPIAALNNAEKKQPENLRNIPIENRNIWEKYLFFFQLDFVSSLSLNDFQIQL